MFQLSIWFLQHWLKKKGIDKIGVIVISDKDYSFDEYDNQKQLFET